jgi:hypothetical protein
MLEEANKEESNLAEPSKVVLDQGLSDIILPSQYFGAMGSGGLCSEQRLMLAVLVDAINVLQGWHGVGNARTSCVGV